MFREVAEIISPSLDEATVEQSPSGWFSPLPSPNPMSLTRLAVRGRLAELLDASASLLDDML